MINNPDMQLPPRLSDEEIYKHFRMYGMGDMQAYGVLIEHNLRLVVYIAAKYENTNVEKEDLVSIGTIGLIKAVETFDIEKNFKFATYASRCINNEILMYLRRIKNKNFKDVSLDAPITLRDGDDKHCLFEMIPSDEYIEEQAYEKDETYKELFDAIMKLDELERKIILGLYPLDGSYVTQKEVANNLGMSQSYISRVKRRACERLEKYINRPYNSSNINRTIKEEKIKVYVKK